MNGDDAIDDFSSRTYPKPQSFTGWLIELAGVYGPLMLAAEVIAIALILMLLKRGKGAFVESALNLVIPLPLVVSLFGLLQRGISMFYELSISDRPEPAGIPVTIFAMLVIAVFGLLISSPGYCLATMSSIRRMLYSQSGIQTPD